MKKVKSIYIIIGLIIVIMLLTTACRKNNKDTLSETPQTPVEINNGQSDDSNDNEEAINNIEVDEVNKLKLSNLDNKEMALLQSKGKPVVLSFWVSWSDHSIKQLETLENVYPLLEGDVIFIAVNATSFETKNEQDLIGYTKAKDLSFEVLLDREGEASKHFYVGSFPTTFFIDAEGNICKLITSNIEEDQLLDEIEMLLEGY